MSPFGALVYEPANNIYVHPNDTIYLYREPQTFLTFGAFGNQQQIPFGTWRISLAEAVAKAGGLRDFEADPASVFLYRGETREVAEAMGIDCSKFQGPIIPVIYNINFRNPGSHFLATTFEMRNKDVIYVSNSVSVEATKFLTYIRTVNATLNDPINTAINAYTLKNIIQGTTATSTAVFTGSAPIASLQFHRNRSGAIGPAHTEHFTLVEIDCAPCDPEDWHGYCKCRHRTVLGSKFGQRRPQSARACMTADTIGASTEPLIRSRAPVANTTSITPAASATQLSARHLLGLLPLTMQTAAHYAVAGASETAGSLESRPREPPPTQLRPAPSPPQRSAPSRLSTIAGASEATR